MSSSESCLQNKYTITIPDTVATYKRLTELIIPDGNIPITINVSQNLLKKLPSSVRLALCRELKLNSNRIAEFKPENYPAIAMLNLSRNHLQPFNFQSLTNLTYLNISHNFISAIPEFPPRLETFICCDNKIAILPPLPITLATLKCCKNRLTQLPEIPARLQILSCKYNKLTRLQEESLMLARRLRHLAYDNNPTIVVSELFLRYIDNHFATLQPVDATRFNPKVIYGDAQNVHSTNINADVLKNVRKLLKTNAKFTLAECLKMFRESGTNNLPILAELCLIEGILGDLGVSFADIFWHFWNYIVGKSYYQEIVKILDADLPEMKQVCFTGRVARLANTLSGLDEDFMIGITENQQIQAKYALVKKQLDDIAEISLLFNIVFYYKFKELLEELQVNRETLCIWLNPFIDAFDLNDIYDKVKYKKYEKYIEQFKKDFQQPILEKYYALADSTEMISLEGDLLIYNIVFYYKFAQIIADEKQIIQDIWLEPIKDDLRKIAMKRKLNPAYPSKYYAFIERFKTDFLTELPLILI